jgi:poly(3-hydroxybutyrate) depolymerase
LSRSFFFLLPLLFCSSLLACAPGDDSCPSAGDGSCGEPLACAYGTDSSDCDAACARDDPSIQPACAHDEALRARQDALDYSSGIGSGGEGGPIGTWDGVISARSAASGSSADRHFRVHVPASYSPERPMPMLFVLGGFQVDLYFLPGYTELDRSAELSDVIVVYLQPEWRDFGSYWVFAWYVYENAWSGSWEGNPDLDFMANLAAHLGGLYNMDRSRTFVSGHSRGAAMAVIATFERPDLFAGFCAQASFLSGNDYDDRILELGGQSPRAGYIIHGDADPDVPVSESDHLADTLEAVGWVEDEDYEYRRLDGVTHFWQPQYNEMFLRFLREHPLPEGAL